MSFTALPHWSMVQRSLAVPSGPPLMTAVFWTFRFVHCSARASS